MGIPIRHGQRDPRSTPHRNPIRPEADTPFGTALRMDSHLRCRKAGRQRSDCPRQLQISGNGYVLPGRRSHIPSGRPIGCRARVQHRASWNGAIAQADWRRRPLRSPHDTKGHTHWCFASASWRQRSAVDAATKPPKCAKSEQLMADLDQRSALSGSEKTTCDGRPAPPRNEMR